MSKRRLTILLTIALIALAATALLSGGAARLFAMLEPDEPAAPTLTANEQVAFWQARVRPGMGDAINLTKLAQAYMRVGRETGDASAYARAEEALRLALETSPNATDTLSTLAAVSISQHQFSHALEIAEQAYGNDPNALQALATIGDANLELGNYDAAAETYATLMDKAPAPEVLARLSRLSWLRGHTGEAISFMDTAATRAAEWGQTGEALAWYHAQLGDLHFKAGDVDQAREQYETALVILPDYYLARVGLANSAAAEGDLETAISAYATVVAQLPQPHLVAALGDLYALHGDTALAQQQYDTVLAIEKLEQANQIMYSRQMALFRADHDLDPARALEMAEAELDARQDVYAYDTLAWALLKNGRPADARAAMTTALAQGTEDALLFYHAGMIAAANDDRDAAVGYLTRALDLNPNFDFLQATVARQTLAGLGG